MEKKKKNIQNKENTENEYLKKNKSMALCCGGVFFGEIRGRVRREYMMCVILIHKKRYIMCIYII